MAGRCGMTGIRQAIDDYLTVRRALGYKLEDHGWLLADFAAFMEAAGAVTVTTSLALAWATLPEDALPARHAARLPAVPGFARLPRTRPAPRSALPRPQAAGLAVVPRRAPADQPGDSLRLPPAGPPGRPAALRAGMPAPAARLPALAGGQYAAGLVPRRPGRAVPPAGAIHLPGPQQAGQHLLVPVSGPRAAGPGRRAP